MLASICVRRLRVGDRCEAQLMIKANMKQMGLHGEMANVTGMVSMVHVLCVSVCSAQRANSTISLIIIILG